MSESRYLVPMSSPEINEDDRQAIMEVLDTSYLSIGPKIESFEESVRTYVGSKEAIGVSSGTTGLHLCVRCAGIQPGDLVLTTPFSFVSSSNVILFEQAIPVFVDVDPLTGNIDPVLVEQSIKDIVSGDPKKVSRWLSRKGAENPGKLKAIIPVDVFGQPVDYDPIQRIAEEHDLVKIPVKPLEPNIKDEKPAPWALSACSLSIRTSRSPRVKAEWLLPTTIKQPK